MGSNAPSCLLSYRGFFLLRNNKCLTSAPLSIIGDPKAESASDSGAAKQPMDLTRVPEKQTHEVRKHLSFGRNLPGVAANWLLWAATSRKIDKKMQVERIYPEYSMTDINILFMLMLQHSRRPFVLRSLQVHISLLVHLLICLLHYYYIRVPSAQTRLFPLLRQRQTPHYLTWNAPVISFSGLWNKSNGANFDGFIAPNRLQVSEVRY